MANRENGRGRLLCLLEILQKETDAAHGLSTQDLISRLYNGRAQDLIAALVRSEGLTRSDLEELRAMFKVEE